MRVLIVSPDLEEKARGINFILKSMVDGLKESGHQVGLLVGLPQNGIFDENKLIESKIEHLYIQHYLNEGRKSFRYLVKGGYRKRNFLKALLRLEMNKIKLVQIEQGYLSQAPSILNRIDYVIKSPYIYQFMTRNISYFPRRQVKKAVKKYGIDMVIVAAPSIIRKKDTGSAKLIHFVHDTMPIELTEAPPDNNTPSKYAKQFFNSVMESDVLLANSEDTATKIAEINKNATTHILYGAPSSKIDALTDTGALRNYSLHPRQYLIFVSTIEKRKNLENLLEAYNLISDRVHMPLVLVGGSGYGIDQIHDKYQSLPEHVREKIIFTGYLSEEEKYSLLKNSSAFVFPSIYEGFGLVVIEAMVCGIPVLTTKRGALPESAGNAALYIDNPYDIKEISEKIYKIVTDSKLRKELIISGYEQSKKYSQKNFNNRLKTVLTRLTNVK